MIDYKFNIVAFGWDETLQKPIKLNGLSYQQMFNDAIKVGAQSPNSTVKLIDAIEVLRG